LLNLYSIGISHHTASLEVREKMWMSNDEIRAAVAHLRDRWFDECMLVSTCNRTELYGISKNGAVPELELKRYLIDAKGSANAVTPDHFNGVLSEEAVKHLFAVAAGIDSMVIGDIQILNQVKEAFQISTELSAMGPVMNRLMQVTLHVGKRVRTETSICEGAVSVSYAAVELASKIFEDLSRKSVLLIGAGETGELTLKHLVGKSIGDVKVANRTRARAEALLENLQVKGTVVDYENIVEGLRTVDIVITSVNSPSYVVSPEDVHKVMKQRSNNPLFIIDIGVPRNVNPAANKVDNVFLYDLDSLKTIVDRNVDRRKADLPRVHAIIDQELDAFSRWYNSLQVNPTIQELREAIESIRQQEVEKNINRFKPEDRELLELVTKRIVNKILHQPMTTLKEGAENGSAGTETLWRVKTLRELFGMSKGEGPTHDS
jgi:glutamyl-tRNA reductase